jgi:glycine betaine/proline transport system permease protein
LSLGISVAFIAIVADRLIHAAAARSRQRLGLTDGGDHAAA